MSPGIPEYFGRFRVVGELGRGAMGVVYRAEDPALGRTVAIKTIALTGNAAERDMHEKRFLQEARAAGGIAHPAIITIYDVGREGDSAFIAMELLEGSELRDLIEAGHLSPSQCVATVAAVADGLGFAHERGVVHRDIKPGNIMVLPDGRVKIMDFGIARLRESTIKTQTGMLLGSPQYMSPEQIAGTGFDHRSDIFSLGVVLYELLTATRPFGGDDVTGLLFSIANAAPLPPSRIATHLPPVVDYIIARALKKAPDERYQSAAEFAQDLRSCIEEVAAAEAAMPPRSALAEAATVPDGAVAAAAARPLASSGEALALRPSTRFDSVEGLARLAVLPTDSDQTRSRAGWTIQPPPMKRRWERTRVLVTAAYALAALMAVAIIFI